MIDKRDIHGVPGFGPCLEQMSIIVLDSPNAMFRGEATIVHNMEPSHRFIVLSTEVLRRLRERKVELPLRVGADLDLASHRQRAAD